MAVQIHYTCEKHKMVRTAADSTIITAASADFDFVHFEFCPDWDGLNKTISFEHESVGQKLALPNANNMCAIPAEVNKFPGFWVSVFGNDGTGKRITSTRDFVIVERSGLGNNSQYVSNPTPDIYAQIYAKIEESDEIAKSVREDADNGVFDGEQGPQGEQGLPGPRGPQGIKGDPGVSVELGQNMFAFGIDGNGHLLVSYEETVSDNPFSINEDGHLIYNVE